MTNVQAEIKQVTGPIFLVGGGEMGERIRTFNWADTPLGPIEDWPQSLKTSVSLMLNSQHPMWIGWGPNASFLYNDAYIQVLSMAKHPSALGKPAAEVWAEIWDVCGPLADKVFQKGEASFVNDVRLFMSRGDFLEETFYSFSYSPIWDESGNVGGLFCPSADVTPKVLNARRLRTLSELAVESLLEKSTEGTCASAAAILARNRDDIPFALLYLMDPEGKIASLQQTIGLAHGQPRISPQKIQLVESTKQTALWPIEDVVKTGLSQVVLLHDIEGFPLGAAAQPVSEAMVLPVISRGQDRPLGVMVVGVNPTRKLDSEYRTFYELVASHVATAIQNARATEEEKKRADMLAELDRAKTTFFSNVSHELRTPLTLILGPLEDEIRESPVRSERLEVAHRNGLRLLKLVNTLLDFSRIEAGRVEPSFEPTDVAAFTAELAGVFRSGIERAGLRLIVECPALSEPVFIDREMWEKIVFNLLSNALKFTARGEIEVKLCEAESHETKSVRLAVRDTGIGIPDAELSRIFERFRRVRNDWARSHEGTGIGLALVQELARMHGGDVEVRSAMGRGTTFTVTIPMGRDHLPAERIGASRTLSPTGVRAQLFLEETMRWLPEDTASSPADDVNGQASPDQVPGSRIVLADDNSDMRGYVQRLLKNQGYDVVAVADGEAALEAIRAQTPALVLSDVMMPRLDGFGLLRELRDDPVTKGVPIILLSARAGEEARVEGVEAGANDYLTKPFNARELLARVASHLELARVRKEATDAVFAATAKFRALFDQSATFSGIMTPDGIIIEANRLCLDACGYRAQEVIGRPFWDCGWWRGSKEVQDKIREATRQAAQGAPYLETLPYHWADGTERVVEFALHPIRDEAGHVVLLHPSGVDITERHEALARTEFLAQLTQKLSTVSDPGEINRIATREIGQFLEVHRCYFFQIQPEPGLAQVLPGWDVEGEKSLAGVYNISDFGSPEWWTTVQIHSLSIEDVRTHPLTRDFAASYQAMNILSYTVVPFLHEGHWVSSLAVTSDKPSHWTPDEEALLENAVARVWPLIERARAEKALREANALLSDKASHMEVLVQQRTAKLRETIGELEAFSYSIAHDMRAPLRSLQGFSNILLADYASALDTEARGFLNRIATSAERMDRLIQDVLNYSRVVRGDLTLERVDVERLLIGIIDTYPMLAPDKADILLEKPLPPVLGNEAMLTQIFSNLLGNGVKFVAPGVKPRLRVWAEKISSHVRLYVQDNGIGIAPDQQEKIFAIFQQVNKDFEGTGIGLAIVKKAIDRMGGKVGVQSNLDHGSTFWIELQQPGNSASP